MKESELKKILTKPVMDPTMDQRMADSLLNHDANMDKRVNKFMQLRYQLSNNAFSYRLSKIAIAVLVLSIAGAGTVYAAGHYVKSYKVDMEMITEEEVDEIKEQIISHDPKTAIKKYFGKGNKLIGPMIDSSGNILDIDEDGYYTFEDGSKMAAVYIPDPNRYENARKSGNEAFAEMGVPNLIPTDIYDNYILGTDGFVYTEYPGSPHKMIMVEFLTDAYGGGDFFEENIWITFHLSETSVESSRSIHIQNEDKDSYNTSSYTTKGGILCSVLEYKDRNNVVVEISFDSETIGNGRMMIEFIGLKWDKITEILDTLPFTEDNANAQTGK